MEEPTSDIGSMANKLTKECTFFPMEPLERVSGKTEPEGNGLNSQRLMLQLTATLRRGSEKADTSMREGKSSREKLK
jgi:hypothetical protein